jgi:hypothetical protein
MADEKPKKLTLKEIAERAAKTQPQLNPAPTRVTYAPGEGLGSTPPASRPPLSQPPGSGAPTSVPPVSQPPASGAPSSVPPASKPPVSAPPPAKPSDKPEAAEKKTDSAKAAKTGAAAKASPAKPVEDNKGGSPLPLLLGGIVLVSIAAVAYAMVNRPQGPSATPLGMAGAASSAAEVASAAPSASVAAPTPSASADPSGAMDIDSLGAVVPPTPADTGKVAHTTGAGGKEADPKKPDTPAVASAAPAASIGPAGELSDEIKKRMGGAGTSGGKTDGDGPSGPPADAKESRPSAGAVAGALNAVRNAARSCLADTEDVAKVNIVFGSSGSVQSASVSGAGKAEGCIKSAMMKAKVAPFTDPTYSTSVTIRP